MPNTIYSSLLHIVLLFTLISCQTEKGNEEPFQILECLDVDSVTSDFPVSFSFIQTGRQQIIAYYNKTRNLTVASHLLSEKNWQYKVLPTRVGWDSHNSITMTLDRDSCIHISGNMHNDSMTYFISQKPLDVASLKKVFPLVDARDELSSTYPGFTKLSSGELVFSYRKGGSGNGITISNIYDEKSKSFKRLTDKPLFDGLNRMSAYASGPRRGPDGLFHVIWLWRNTPACETNHHLSYARSRDLVHWENAFGERFDLPITPESRAYDVDPTPPGGGMINGAFCLFFDAENKPLIAYMKYDENGNNQLYLAQKNQEKWQCTQLTHWHYRWEFSGPGSISFEIRILGANVKENKLATLAYLHKEEGEGVLTIDLETRAVIKDEKVSATKKQAAYPAELMQVEHKMEGMNVHWMKKLNPDNDAEFYALRWETLGKRRFYEAPEVPVKPAAMKMYKIKRVH